MEFTELENKLKSLGFSIIPLDFGIAVVIYDKIPDYPIARFNLEKRSGLQLLWMEDTIPSRKLSVAVKELKIFCNEVEDNHDNLDKYVIINKDFAFVNFFQGEINDGSYINSLFQVLLNKDYDALKFFWTREELEKIIENKQVSEKEMENERLIAIKLTKENLQKILWVRTMSNFLKKNSPSFANLNLSDIFNQEFSKDEIIKLNE